MRTLTTSLMVLAMVAGSSQASVIFNVTDDQAMFDAGGFESGASGSVPIPDDPTIGTYTTILPGTFVQYRDAGFGVTPVTPNEGNISLYVERQNPDLPFLDMSSVIGTSDPGDVVELRTAFHMVSGVAAVRLVGTFGETITLLDIFSNGTIKAFDGAVVSTFATTSNAGLWNDLVVRYTNGDASNLSISVNGSAFETLSGAIDTAGNLDTVRMFADGNNTAYYLDASVPTLTGDFTGDGFVGIADLNLVLGNWNAGTPPPTGNATIPEPASMALLGLGGVALLRRRKV